MTCNKTKLDVGQIYCTTLLESGNAPQRKETSVFSTMDRAAYCGDRKRYFSSNDTLAYLIIFTLIAGFIFMIDLNSAVAMFAESQILPSSYMVEVDAFHQDGRNEHGFGLVVGSVGRSLLAATTNHTVRAPNGKVAKKIDFRMSFEAGRVYSDSATVTGLFDQSRDLAIIALKVPKPVERMLAAPLTGCAKLLDIGAKVYALGRTQSDKNSARYGLYAGYDESGDIIFRGLHILKGHSGAPLVDEDGATLGIIKSSKGITKLARAISIEYIEKLLVDKHIALDKDFRPISDSRPISEQRMQQHHEALKCEMFYEHCKRYQKWCVEANSLKCQRFRQMNFDDCRSADQTKFHIILKCDCAELKAAKYPISEMGWRAFQRQLYCAAPDLQSAVLALLQKRPPRNDFDIEYIVYSGLFPSVSDLEGLVVETTPGSISALYNDLKERVRKAEEDPEYFGPDEIPPTEIQEILKKSLVVGDPLCYRIPNAYAQSGRGGDRAESFLFDDKIEVSRIKRGISVCYVKVGTGVTRGCKLGPFVKVGGRWVWVPGRSAN
ncbi:MAG: serine protease [Desulfobacterales bacterium]|jgi:hypothetical protein